MASNPNGPPILTLSSSRFSEEKRLPAFRDAFSESILPCRIDPVSDEPFWADLQSVHYGPVEVTSIAGSPMRCETEQSDTDSAEAGLLIDIVLVGSNHVSHGGRNNHVRVGEAAIYHTQMPFLSVSPVPLETRSVMLPDALLRSEVGDASRLAGMVLDRTVPEMLLLPSYLEALEAIHHSGDTALRLTVGRHLSDLMIAALSRMSRREDPTEGRGIRAARLSEVHRILNRDLSQMTLNAARVARKLGVSERYVQKLLEGTGTTFSAYLMERRLKEAYRVLAEDRQQTLSVREIAWAQGFADASHFTRAFRRRFGETPTSVRGTERMPVAAE